MPYSARYFIRVVTCPRDVIHCGQAESARRGRIVVISGWEIPLHAFPDKASVECGLICWRVSGHCSGPALIRHGNNLAANVRVGARLDRIVAAHDVCLPASRIVCEQPSVYRRGLQVRGVAGFHLVRPVRENPARPHSDFPRHRIARLLPAPERDAARRRRPVAEQVLPTLPRGEIEQSGDLRPRRRG